ncbi:MAG: PaaI family thioesterase [Acidimicrobiia bacterium]
MRWFQQPGIDTIREMISGSLPGAPPSRLFGSGPTDVGLGKVTFSMPVTRWLEDSLGIVEPAIFALFADAPVASALWSALPEGKVATTSELNMSFLRPVTRATERLVGFAETVHLGRQVGLANLRITDQNGRLMAHATTRCLIADVPVDFDGELDPPDTGPNDPADPYLRDPPGPDLYWPQEWITTLTPTELMKRSTASENGSGMGPVARLTGLEPVFAAGGRSQVTLPTSPWFSNGGPAIYGGVLAWLADLTMGAAAYSLLDVGGLNAPLDLNVRYVRPALINSGRLTAEARVIHQGNRLRVLQAEVRSEEQKPVAVATSSMLVLPNGAFDLIEGKPAHEIIGGSDA